jgi:hypothetical protein
VLSQESKAAEGMTATTAFLIEILITVSLIMGIALVVVLNFWPLTESNRLLCSFKSPSYRYKCTT